MATHLFGDTAVLTGRSLRHITRSPDTIITTALMPIAMMLLFVYLFGGASAFSYPLIFLPFLSSAFVPTETMPGPVRALAENQPATSIVNTIRTPSLVGV
ncbi:hypothetical protein [Kribbella pittospori]|uniref:hypothetical protein n=1 Tax=Kribbella pittospori TaxID=722689 RepID=UPI0023528BC8|nr:hypothetical protein [Kribbella pittospori]